MTGLSDFTILLKLVAGQLSRPQKAHKVHLLEEHELQKRMLIELEDHNDNSVFQSQQVMRLSWQTQKVFIQLS